MVLEVKKRDNKIKADIYRKNNLIPGVIYGPEIDSTCVYLEKKIFLSELKHLHQKFEFIFENKKYMGILQEIQKHPITLEPIHFDIYVPKLTETIVTTVSFIFKGEEEILKSGYFVNKILHELEVEGYLKDIPDFIEVDVSKLNLGESIYVKDLNLKNIKPLIDENTPIVSIVEEKFGVLEEKEYPAESQIEQEIGEEK
jgi:large subunit ribosomal protein L25